MRHKLLRLFYIKQKYFNVNKRGNYEFIHIVIMCYATTGRNEEVMRYRAQRLRGCAGYLNRLVASAGASTTAASTKPPNSTHAPK